MLTFTVQISGCFIGFMYMCICCFHFNLSYCKSYPNVFKCFFFAFSLQIYQFLSTFIRAEGCPQVEVGLQTQFQIYSLYFSLPLISTCEASHTILTNLANWGTLQPELRSRAPLFNSLLSGQRARSDLGRRGTRCEELAVRWVQDDASLQKYLTLGFMVFYQADVNGCSWGL